MTTGMRLVAVMAVFALLATGCTSEDTPEDDHDSTLKPTLTSGECPPDVEFTINHPHECGVLTVPVNRDNPSKGTLDLTVARAQPQGGSDPDRFGFTYGTEFGNADSVGGGMTGGATTMDIVSLKLEWRGTGPRADPSLQCPEIGALASTLADSPTGDEIMRADFVDIPLHRNRRRPGLAVVG